MNGLVSFSQDNKFYINAYNNRGDVTKTIDNTGKISGTIKYTDYGAVVSQTGVTSTFKYAGQYGAITDNNGLVYLKTRYYNPQLMRFMNRDTVAGSITDSQSLNRFSYVEGNPLTYVDLNGQARTWLSSHFGILGGLGWDGLEMIPVLGNVMSVIDLVGDLASGESAFAISMDMLGIFGGGEIKGAGKALELLSHLKLSRLSRISDELLSRFGRQYELAGIGDVGRLGNSSDELRAFSSKISDGVIHSKTFASLDDLDDYTKSFIKSQKPKNAPDVNKWISKGGKIDIDGTGTWTYTNKSGDFVPYVDGFPDFKAGGYVRQEVNIGSIGDYSRDFTKADKLAPLGSKLPTSTWHHYQDAKTMQEVDYVIHKQFTHRGGMSIMRDIMRSSK